MSPTTCGWGPRIISFAPQGSWAHETIIKPQPEQPFDADLLVFVEAKDGWAPKDYVNSLATGLAKLPAYKEKVLPASSHVVKDAQNTGKPLSRARTWKA